MRGLHTFSKVERLTSKKQIDELFENGSSFFCHPFKVVFLVEPTVVQVPDQVLISVPKKIWKRAVDRNLIKRRIREAYRIWKVGKATAQTNQIHARRIIGFIYTSKVLHSYVEISRSMALVLQSKKFHC